MNVAIFLCENAPTSFQADKNLGWFMGGSFGISLAATALAALVFYIVYKRAGFWNSVKNNLTYLFIAVLFLGFVVYDIGLYPKTGENLCEAAGLLLAVAPMAVIHAFKMFILESDVSSVHQDCFNNPCYMFFFSLVHFLAALISLAFVIKHFGYNIIARIRMSWNSRFGKKEKLFVFWGMNEGTYLLAKSINDKLEPTDKKEKKNYSIVVVRTHSDQDSTSERNGMERLFNFLSLRNKDLDRLEDLKCLTTNSFESPALLSIPDNNSDISLDILQKQLRLRAVDRMIRKRITKEVHFFFLSDDEKDNIQSVANLKRDKTLNDFITTTSQTNHKKVFLYCRARYNSAHRVIEDGQLRSDMEVKVIDSSHICVELLKQKTELQPVNFVKIEDDATVSTPFNALVVGFGEVGLDSVRFLYEFGAFVKQGSTDANVVRSDFHCDVVDKNMSALAGVFFANAPAINTCLAFEEDKEDCKVKDDKKDALITLHEMDYQSVSFYKKLEQWIKELNYVLIATESDEENISLAIRIFRLAVRYRVDMKRFCIMVRIKNDEDGHFDRMANHYNRLLLAMNQSNDSKREHQNIIRKNQPTDGPIFKFGEERDAYTYKNIIDKAIENEAKGFYRIYDNGHGDWDKRHKELLQLTKGQYYVTPTTKDNYDEAYAPTYVGMLSLRRQEHQDFANSMHKATKQILFKEALRQSRCQLESLINRSDKMMKDTTTNKERLSEIRYFYQADKPLDPKLRRIIDVLAQTEHLRWNASHEILGYRYDTKKDEARLLHNCLVAWQDLSLDYQSYDYNVVDVSLDEIKTSMIQDN